jgi:hypothetical protein
LERSAPTERFVVWPQISGAGRGDVGSGDVGIGRSGLKPLIQELNKGNAHIVLLCRPEDFGDEWEYVQQVVQVLYSTHRSDVWFPTAKSSP